MNAPSPRFGRYAERYARYRLTYPPELYDRLDSALDGPRERVVDLGAGTGQVALELLERFASVTAIDPDADMVAQIPARERLTTIVARAEEAAFPDDSVDAVTAGTAFHWMDEHAVCARAARWLRPGGVFLAFVYDAFDFSDAPAVKKLLRREGRRWARHMDSRLHDLSTYPDRVRSTGAFTRVESFEMIDERWLTPAELAGFALTTSFGTAYAEGSGDEAAYAADFTARLTAAAEGRDVLVRYPIRGALAWA